MVGLTELRAGIENANSGNFPTLPPPPVVPSEPEESDAESGNIINKHSDEDTEMLANRDDSNIDIVLSDSETATNQRRKNST